MGKSRRVFTSDMLSKERQQQLWKRTTETPNGCLIWEGCKNNRGYGLLTVHGHIYLTHIIAYTLRKQPVPPDGTLYHTCKNRACINPDHLQLSDPESPEWKARMQDR